MAITTVLVVRYRGGYVEVSQNAGTYGRREALVQVDVGQAEQATEIGNALLDLIARPQTTIAAETLGSVAAPTTRAGFGYRPGQFINLPDEALTGSSWQRVIGLSVDVGADSVYRFIPECGDPRGEREDEINRVIRRMQVGSLASTAGAVPVLPQRRVAGRHQPTVVDAVFSLAGPLTVSSSPQWTIRRDAKATKITASLVTSGSTDTVVTLTLNGSAWESITVLSGDSEAEKQVQEALPAGSRIRASVASAGSGAEDLTVQVAIQDENSPEKG